ncbi:MAG TPA: zinc ribbon domain-containing protein [Armatimonadota bacterium]|jgi:putative FmdB family regulatory protein|nr:zinc ribbon domain-containing protein [Armatimonadota bacterium]HOM71264.1 zinc ribbon domain-containing protein [Armatimonadota bacterium]HOP79784.1 zinc ribbon domain-containing protein [Armatimonadota bacterium]HPP75703.1 zinc ribbon domain-containing protein [Armatimonadota bacterium]
MPTYGYECRDCGHQFEVIQKITDDPVSACEKCNGRVRRVIFPVGIMFKGSGFHVNDYSKSGPSSNGKKTEESKPEKTVETTKS